MNNTQIKTGNMIINSQQYTNLGTLSNNNNSSIFGNSSIKNDSGINLKKIKIVDIMYIIIKYVVQKYSQLNLKKQKKIIILIIK